MKVSLFQIQPLSLPHLVSNNKTQQKDSFADFLKNNLNKVNDLQREADSLTKKMIVGDNVDLHQVMIATEKAEIAMQLTLQIRNKLIEAYQELSRMQI